MMQFLKITPLRSAEMAALTIPERKGVRAARAAYPLRVVLISGIADRSGNEEKRQRGERFPSNDAACIAL